MLSALDHKRAQCVLARRSAIQSATYSLFAIVCSSHSSWQGPCAALAIIKLLKMHSSSTLKPTTGKWVKATPDDEVVEDSEPEREEQRRVEKKRRREGRTRNKPLEVIEVSDNSFDAIAAPAPAKFSHSVERGSVIIISGSLPHVNK